MRVLFCVGLLSDGSPSRSLRPGIESIESASKTNRKLFRPYFTNAQSELT